MKILFDPTDYYNGNTVPKKRRKKTIIRPFTPTYCSIPDAGSQYLLTAAELIKTNEIGIPSPTSGPRPWIQYINGDESSNAWDGVTTFDCCGKTYLELLEWLFPGGEFLVARVGSRPLRGLMSLYDSTQPFANPAYPTVKEMEEWNLRVMNLFRALVGRPPMEDTRLMMLKSQWNMEKRLGGFPQYINWDNKMTMLTKENQISYLQAGEIGYTAVQAMKHHVGCVITELSTLPPSLWMSRMLLKCLDGSQVGDFAIPNDDDGSILSGPILDLIEYSKFGYTIYRSIVEGSISMDIILEGVRTSVCT